MTGNSRKRKGKNFQGSDLPPKPSTPMQGGFDGPSSPPPTAGHRGPNPFAPGLGFDPAKAAPKKESVITNTRVELPQAAYKLDGGDSPSTKASRTVNVFLRASPTSVETTLNTFSATPLHPIITKERFAWLRHVLVTCVHASKQTLTFKLQHIYTIALQKFPKTS
ncbi:hypothetical protein BP6252_09251 [Coleophoma cylindrospora]|uniref:Uncharacterized protein n=1 Tax=Coleophoma cylindrospora TaxID=1849047 RepID=A0A3D8R1E9_9HELO|nr:hypothetical protein BP6252_09251 [Coleophoma cylindrospora]